MNGTEHPPPQPVARPTVRTLLYVLFGPIVWAAHFTIIYGMQSVACVVNASPHWIGSAILAATVVALLALGAGWRWLANPGGAMSEGAENRNHFLESVMRLLALLAAFGIVAAGATALALPSCPALR